MKSTFMTKQCRTTARAATILGLVLIGAARIALPAAAQAVDPHTVYADRCAICHGSDPQALAHETLRFNTAGTIVRTRGTALRGFLDRHGRLAPPEADAVSDMLQEMLTATQEPGG
jgi:mono/diheme cytochrome c family protein